MAVPAARAVTSSATRAARCAAKSNAHALVAGTNNPALQLIAFDSAAGVEVVHVRALERAHASSGAGAKGRAEHPGARSRPFRALPAALAQAMRGMPLIPRARPPSFALTQVLCGLSVLAWRTCYAML
eukprot:1134340-Rhodomonas_salina.1